MTRVGDKSTLVTRIVRFASPDTAPKLALDPGRAASRVSAGLLRRGLYQVWRRSQSELDRDVGGGALPEGGQAGGQRAVLRQRQVGVASQGILSREPGSIKEPGIEAGRQPA